MKLYIGLIVLVVGVSCAVSYDHNETKHHQVNVQGTQISAPNHLTVEAEMERSETMTEARGQDVELAQGRTFGIKRLQMMLLPLMYKMGVMTTLLVLLVALALKGLMIGVLLLGLKVGSVIAKFHQYQSHQPIWSPPPYSYHQPQPVHVHWHQDDPHHGSYGHPTSYDRQDQQVQDLVYPGWTQLPSPNPFQKPVAIDSYGQYVYKG